MLSMNGSFVNITARPGSGRREWTNRQHTLKKLWVAKARPLRMRATALMRLVRGRRWLFSRRNSKEVFFFARLYDEGSQPPTYLMDEA